MDRNHIRTQVLAGLASLDELEQLGESEVSTIKAAETLQYRICSGEVRAAEDDGARVLSFIASDETPDRMGDIIRVKGWELGNYKKNPVILWGHDGSSLPIGKARRVTKGTKADGAPALLIEVEFAPADAHAFAETVYQLAKSGFLNAVSVGFLPVKVTRPETPEERMEMGLGPWGVVYEKAELLEVSVVSVPANPSALQNGMRSLVERGLVPKQVADQFLDSFAVSPESYEARRKALSETFAELSERLAALPEGGSEGAEQSSEGQTGDSHASSAASDAGQSGPPSPTTFPVRLTFFGEGAGNTGGEWPRSVTVGCSGGLTTGGEPYTNDATGWVPSVTLGYPTLGAPSPAAPDYSLLVGALARLLEQQTEQVAAMRQLADTLTDLSRKVVDLADARGGAVPAPNAAASGGKARDGGLSDSELHELRAFSERLSARLGKG